VAALETRDPQRILTGTTGREHHAVTFLFPGLGDHYVNMAKQLYQLEPTFREHVDRCCALLKPYLELDLRDVWYPNRNGGDGQKLSASLSQQSIDLRALLGRGQGQVEQTQAYTLHQTALAQPALFVIEYALAQLWISWGALPQAMIGYSMGEYVAACLAGVMSLEDALALVARRAQMIQELPEGAMLAVALTEQEVQPLLGTELSLSAVNGARTCVVA